MAEKGRGKQTNTVAAKPGRVSSLIDTRVIYCGDGGRTDEQLTSRSNVGEEQVKILLVPARMKLESGAT
jgi:hypothetical protein